MGRALAQGSTIGVQAGCISVVLVILALVAGLWLDRTFNTQPLFVLGLLLLSIPVSLVAMVYTVLKWYVIDGDRVVYECLNRADNPEPGAPPIDFPSYQIVDYAGGGKWGREEDIWIVGEMRAFANRYREAERAFPQTLEDKLSRNDWGHWVEWARPGSGHQARPSWSTKSDFKPFRGIADINFGVRSH